MGQSIFMILLMVAAFIFFKFGLKQRRKSDTWISDFESKINNHGFTKRIVVYDFLPYSVKAQANKNWYTIGIWFDYPNRFMAIRLDRNATDLIDISFDKIQSIEIIEDGYLATSGGGLGMGPVVIGSATSKEKSKGLQVRIVTGNINIGTQAYFLKLYDPQFGSISKSNLEYKAIKECARSIVDECENIMRHSRQY